MRIYKTYRGAELNLEAYKGKTSDDYEIEVTYDDGTAFDLSIYSSITCKIFYRKGFTEIISPTITTAANVVVFNLTKAQSTLLQEREYYYFIYGTFATTEEEMITYGIFKVV